MMCNKNILIFSLVTLVYVKCETPSFITKCATEDTKCAKSSAQVAIPVFASGLPEYGVDTLDPIIFKKLDASSAALKLILSDITLTGLKGCHANKIERSPDNSNFTVKITCDVELNGQYEINGQLFVVPIEGNGKTHIKLRKIFITSNMNVEGVQGADGNKHWKIKTWTHSYELKDKADVVLENLFGGNELLGRVARELVSNSGNEIIIEIGPPIVKSIVKKIIDSVNAFFKHVPIQDLAID